MLGKIFAIALVYFVAISSAKILDLSKLDLTNINCNASSNIIDECSVLQGYSFRNREAPYPTTTGMMIAQCKRSADALKCLRAYSKCLPPLPRQIMNVMIQSRKAHNKKLCTDPESEAVAKFIQLGQCMNNKVSTDKGLQAEFRSIVLPEAISATKMSIDDRLKYSCCSVAANRREFIEATVPECKQHKQTMADLVDSYVAEAVGLICPDFNNPKPRFDCNKLAPLNLSRVPMSRFFVRPIIYVVQNLNPLN